MTILDFDQLNEVFLAVKYIIRSMLSNAHV